MSSGERGKLAQTLRGGQRELVGGLIAQTGIGAAAEGERGLVFELRRQFAFSTAISGWRDRLRR
jgi:hypothetical protein